MKNLLILATLLTSLSTYAVTLKGNFELSIAVMQNMDNGGQAMGALTSINTSILSTTIASPIAGVIVFTDSETAMIDMDNEVAIEEVELIQIALEDGEELSDFQNAVLEIGMTNGQLDEDANILE
jgi:hypothetical protein